MKLFYINRSDQSKFRVTQLYLNGDGATVVSEDPPDYCKGEKTKS